MKFICSFIATLLFSSITLYSQLCPGGGLTFATAVGFNQGWISGCPGTAIFHNNQTICRPALALDICAPTPICPTGTMASDLWYYFYAGATTATIVVNPSFDAAIQAFSGATCPGLTEIGCVDAGGNAAAETLSLTGLTAGQLYYFRVFGATNSDVNRAGTYDFCGTSSTLLQFALPVRLTAFTASVQKSSVLLRWTTASEIDHDHYELERSNDNITFTVIGTTAARGGSNASTNYTLRDITAQPGMNYYRLKIVDINGRYTYSNIVASKMNTIRSLAVIQNPVNNILTIQSQQARQVLLMNSAGQRIKSISLKKGINEIPVKDLKNGIYYLADNTGSEEPEKFVVSH